MAALFAAVVFLAVTAAAAHDGCPACGSVLRGRKAATVHPGEPARMLFGIPSAEECASECKAASPDLLFFQHFRSKVHGGELTCLCLATCYSIYDAEPSEDAVVGSLCRDLPCSTACSNAPAANLMYLGNPSRVVLQGFSYMSMNGSNGNGTVNATIGPYLMSNGTFRGFSNSSNSTSGNSTVAAVFGMTYEECRAYAATNAAPATPFFTHLEAMGACLMFETCIGMGHAGTKTAQSGSFCLPSLLRGAGMSVKAEVV